MRLFLSFVFSVITLLSFCQKCQKVILTQTDPDNIYFSGGKDSSSLFYVKFVPKGKIKGVLVLLPGAGETVDEEIKQLSLPKLAIDNNILLIFPSINSGPVTSTPQLQFLDKVFKNVVENFKVSKNNFIIGGFSNGAMVSLIYAENSKKDPGEHFLLPKAILAIDPPLDFAHLWNHCKKDIERNFSEAAVEEGRSIMNGYRKEFGGSPEEAPQTYLKYSIYSYSEKDGGNAKYLINMPLRIITQPGILWQIENRHRDLYDLNCTDISAMVNLLRLEGNNEAELIISEKKGVRLNGTIHPHSWSIMDSDETLKWLIRKFKN